MTDYEIHPAADLFPMMTEEEYQGLLADMREHGQREWAALLGDKLLESRGFVPFPGLIATHSK